MLFIHKAFFHIYDVADICHINQAAPSLAVGEQNVSRALTNNSFDLLEKVSLSGSSEVYPDMSVLYQ